MQISKIYKSVGNKVQQGRGDLHRKIAARKISNI